MMATRVQDHPPRNNVFTDLRAPGLLAKWPMIGVIMFIFGSLMLGGLTNNLLAQGSLLEWDRVLANTLPAIGLQSPAFVKGIMAAGFYMEKK
jgi:hypothetical protein